MVKKRLGLKQEVFCVEYAKTLKPIDAYLAAYGSDVSLTRKVASKRAAVLLKLPHVQARIETLRAGAVEKMQMEVDDVLSRWIQIATANPNTLVQYRRTCCRFCYGLRHAYQWTEYEYAIACATAIDNQRSIPDGSGGFGFNPTLDPVNGCTTCFGEGVGDVYIADTRKLSDAARALYAGIKQTNHGVQVLMRDQDDALRNIAKFLGMFKERVELSGQPLTLELSTNLIEAAQTYQQIMGAK